MELKSLELFHRLHYRHQTKPAPYIPALNDGVFWCIGDKKPIRKVHENAFDQSEGETVSQLAIDLLEDKTALPILSLVAERDNEIIGNIIFSSVNIAGVEGVSAYILAPLAVTRFAQRSGIGTQLINKGLETLKERGAEIVIVYGDPNSSKHPGVEGIDIQVD